MISLLYRRKSSVLKKFLSTTSCRNSYIVLVPEIGEEDNSTESLVKPDGLLHFNGLTVENCQAAIAKQSALVEQTVKGIEINIAGKENLDLFEDVFHKLENVTGPLETTWGIAKTIYLGYSTLMPTKSYLNIHERARRARASKFSNDIIFKKIKNFNENVDIKIAEEKRLVEKYLLEGKLNGLDLSEADKRKLEDITDKLGQERANFKNKVNQSIKQFRHELENYALVREFPLNLLESIAVDPHQPTNGPWKISLQPHIVEEFLKYCPDRMERWNVWQADVRKASGLSEKNLENSTHIEKIRGLRKRQAELLGYKNYATMSMETKMIKTVENAKEMFTTLLKHAGPIQQTEITTLQDFANDSGFKHKLEIYDILYWQRKYLKSNYNLDENIIREYFTLSNVLNGLFEISEKLFNIKIAERKNVEVWHSGVKYYDVFDKNISDEEPIAGFYLDCYSRENQFNRNLGWMVGIRNRNVLAESKPLSAIIFNFNTTFNDNPYLLTMEDLQMIFKNFGSALQHLLTKANYTDLAGLSNIEWDASQICGNVLINFLNDEKVLKKLSSHYSSGNPLPDDLLQNINLFRTHLSAYKLCKELYLCDLDLELYSSTDFWLDVVKKLWPIYNIIPLNKIDSHPCSMQNIFSGDWGAAYFSNLYSRLIAADIYDAFIENEIKNVGNGENTTGIRFKETFLSYGGSMKTEEIFRRFRGRDPTPVALLKSLNIHNVSQTSDV